MRRLGRLRMGRPMGEPRTTFHNYTVNLKLLNRQNQDDTFALLWCFETLTEKFDIGQ